MALTRKFLSAMGIEGDKVDEIINAHVDTVDALKAERDEAKREAESLRTDAKALPKVQKELDELKAAQESGTSVFETKYNDLKAKNDELQKEYTQYKADVEADKTKRAKESAYKNLLRDANIPDKRIDKILKVTDLNGIKLDKEGALENKDDLVKSIKDEWSDFIVKERQEGATTATPLHTNTETPRGKSRAAQLAESYHSNLYGTTAKEDK